MSTETRLTINDPVAPEDITTFEAMDDLESALGRRLLTLEAEKVQVLASHRRVRDDHQRLFEKILVERGLAPSAPVTLDYTSRKLALENPAPVVPEASPPKE